MAQLILVSLFPLIALIMMGFFLKRCAFVEDGFWRSVEKINYYILFPVMLFMALASAKIELSTVGQLMQAIILVLIVACIVLYAIRKIYQTKSARFGVYMQSNVRFNTYIGLALVATLLALPGMAIFAMMLAFCIPLVNILSILAMTEPEKMNMMGILSSLAKNPLILGCIVGAGFNASGLMLWDGLEDFLNQLARCSLPLGLLTVGAALKLNGFKTDLLPLLLNTFSRLLLMPLLAFAVCSLLHLPLLQTQVLVLFFALPTASASYILTKVLGGDSEMMANIISLQTICALFTLPMMIYLVM